MENWNESTITGSLTIYIYSGADLHKFIVIDTILLRLSNMIFNQSNYMAGVN